MCRRSGRRSEVILVATALATATTTAPPSLTRNNFQFALCIGSCITAGGFAVGAVSGASLNPGVAIGIAFQGFCGFGKMIHYALFELTGGLMAAMVFRSAS